MSRSEIKARTWGLVHAERQSLVDDLADLTPEQWATPSLCSGWSVRDVAAHLVNTAMATPVGLVVDMARARFDFDRQNQRGVERELGSMPQDTWQRLQAVVGRTTGPPVSLDSRLVEEVVHGEDIRRVLGLTRHYPVGAVEPALRYQARTSVSIGGGKQRIAKVRLVATDAEVSVGDGPEVHGPLVSLLLVTSGRDAALADLHGPGLAHLSQVAS